MKWIKIGYAYVFVYVVWFLVEINRKDGSNPYLKCKCKSQLNQRKFVVLQFFLGCRFSSSSSHSSWVNPLNRARWCEWNYMARYAIGSVRIWIINTVNSLRPKTEWIVLHQNRNPCTRTDEKTEWCKANFTKINQNWFAKPMCHLMLIKPELSVRRIV